MENNFSYNNEIEIIKEKLDLLTNNEKIETENKVKLVEILNYLINMKLSFVNLKSSKIINVLKKILGQLKNDKNIIKLAKKLMINCKNKNTEIKLEEKVVIPSLELKEEEPDSNTSNNSNSNLNKNQNEMNHINYKEIIEKEEKDPMRRNAKLLMFNSLLKSTNESSDTNNIFTIISNIEKDLINTFSKDKVKYLKQVKQIVMGIQNNKEFVENILTGTITPFKISQMSTNDFASEAIKEHRKKLQEDAFNSRRSDWNYLRNPGVPGIYCCRKCKCNRTTYYQAQIRRADEPMTTFITCLECAFQWKQ